MEHQYADPDFEFWLTAVRTCLEDMGADPALVCFQNFGNSASEARQLFEDGLPPADAAVELMA